MLSSFDVISAENLDTELCESLESVACMQCIVNVEIRFSLSYFPVL